MKKVLLTLVAMTIMASSYAQEISLYDKDGEAVAYIDTSDDLTIYLWGGAPVAYLEDGNIWGFNGNHLGWFEDGIMRNQNGDVVGFVKGAVSGVFINFESFKGFKDFKGFKGFKEFVPFKPFYSNSFSNMPLSLFLALGKD